MSNVKTYIDVDGETRYFIYMESKFCGECVEDVSVNIDVDAWTQDEEGEPCEPEYDDTIGNPYCADCGSENLYDDEDDYARAVQDNYLADRADAIRKGEW